MKNLTKAETIQYLSEKGFNVPSLFSLEEALVLKEKLFAVRSSDIREDSSTESKAGFFDTFLFVKNSLLKEKIDTVLKKAGNYFIQEMIDPDFSCVVLAKAGVIKIIANNGLCEMITSGKVNGVTYTYNEESCFLKARGTQKYAMVYNLDMEVIQVVSDKLKSFNDSNIMDIVDILERIRKIVDYENINLEISVKNDTIFILQCRELL